MDGWTDERREQTSGNVLMLNKHLLSVLDQSYFYECHTVIYT